MLFNEIYVKIHKSSLLILHLLPQFQPDFLRKIWEKKKTEKKEVKKVWLRGCLCFNRKARTE